MRIPEETSKWVSPELAPDWTEKHIESLIIEPAKKSIVEMLVRRPFIEIASRMTLKETPSIQDFGTYPLRFKGDINQDSMVFPFDHDEKGSRVNEAYDDEDLVQIMMSLKEGKTFPVGTFKISTKNNRVYIEATRNEFDSDDFDVELVKLPKLMVLSA